MKLWVAIACIGLAGCSQAPNSPKVAIASQPTAPVIDPHYNAKFWSVWGDGKAEVNTYDLTFPRYNQKRKGIAVAIFVTEPFSNALRVKADPGKHDPSSVTPVMKLNLVKKYQTGIYDYSDMTSTFVSLAPINNQPAGSTMKVSFGSQEWCGHVYMQMLFDQRRTTFTQHSYFDGEADQQRDLDSRPEGMAEDSLMLWARGVARPWSESASPVVMTSLETLRAKHIAPAWAPATLSKENGVQTLQVPAGAIEVEVFRAKRADGFTRTFYVETASPRRMVKWETTDGETAELCGSERLKYWEMNEEGGEAALKRLGISRVAPFFGK